MSKSTVRYAIYTRQSVSDEGKVLSSCDVQLDICRDFIQAQADSSWKWISRRFDDVGFSGASTDRPALQRLLTHIENRDVDKVVVYRLDRLTRRLMDCVDILTTFRDAGVELLIVTAPELRRAATDKLLLNVMATFAEFERDMIRSRLADTRAALKRHGRRLAGPPPYGYDIDPRTKQLVVNAAEARRVKAMFQAAANGKLPSGIAADANRRGWRTRRSVAERSGRASGGGPWSPRQVLTVLRNPVHIGCFHDGKGRRPGQHDAIVSLELFEQVQEQITARRKSGPRRRYKGRAPEWPLRGKIICPGCGRTMGTHNTHNGNLIYRHYRCRSHAGGQPPCKGIAFPAYELEATVMSMLGERTDPSGAGRVSPGVVLRMRRFQVIWGLLDFMTQRRLLPEVVESIRFSESDSELSVSLNRDAVARVVNNPQELCLSGRRPTGRGGC